MWNVPIFPGTTVQYLNKHTHVPTCTDVLSDLYSETSNQWTSTLLQKMSLWMCPSTEGNLHVKLHLILRKELFMYRDIMYSETSDQGTPQRHRKSVPT